MAFLNFNGLFDRSLLTVSSQYILTQFCQKFVCDFECFPSRHIFDLLLATSQNFHIKTSCNKSQKMAEDWDEIKKLAADLQRAQLGGTVQKLSERNCIEIVNVLIKNGLLKVIYTTDGKEYLTHKQLERELFDELYVSRGL